MVALPHPGVDQDVHVGQIGEGDDAGAEQPGPVYVVVHVVWVHSQPCDIVGDPFMGDIVIVLVLNCSELGLQELGDVQEDGNDHGWDDVGHHTNTG